MTADPLDMAGLLLRVMQQLVQAGSVPRDRWPAAAPAPERFGLVAAESVELVTGVAHGRAALQAGVLVDKFETGGRIADARIHDDRCTGKVGL